ncbi:histidine racemase CntK [Staphylococcus caeli]|uniref:Similar to diaminopimelate epimerase n=1 Tax=Staphylococcus caeli TaxID=2201815 RepID=A0A1D4LFH8_9STAP|nr:histidine racemase CntK [Staphylococcus caeli]SCS68029.1 Putative Similar to diaminopimelate epimerase [Staphylococcus caeli]SCS84777.1 Putative Similar to diaminopimelate epimerase [Staphylococcus caeli]
MTKRRVQFSKYNPTGNMTVLVHSEHNRTEYAEIANQMMQTSHVCCEQVGFIESVRFENCQNFKLVMSGNEFCGNATISFLHYLNEQHLIKATEQLNALKQHTLQIQVSGRSDLVDCKVHNDGYYEVSMPQPQCVDQVQLTLRNQSITATRINYESYLHYVIPIDHTSQELQQEIEQFVRTTQWEQSLKTIGIMLFNRKEQYLSPLIYLPEVQSIIWENSCGSGTASIGIFEAYHTKRASESLVVHQPGGHIIVSTNFGGNNYHTTIKGKVTSVATGTAYIE